MVFELRLIPPSIQFSETEIPSRLVQPRPQGSFYPQLLVRRLMSQGEQDTSISHPTLSYLQRLSSLQVQLRGGRSLLVP